MVRLVNRYQADFRGMNDIPCCIYRARTISMKVEDFRLVPLEAKHSKSLSSVDLALPTISVV